MLVKEAIVFGTNILKKNCDNPRFIVKKLLAFLLDKDITYIEIHNNFEMNKKTEEKFNESINKILNGYPLQYITNTQSFMGLNFYVDENVLIPQPDTEILVEEAIEIEKRENKTKILDLCTGSGAIAISLAKYLSNSNVFASDIKKKALDIAKKNAKTNMVEVEFIESNLFQNIKTTFDLIVSNPPYIKTRSYKNFK